jgi:hypothetical protein
MALCSAQAHRSVSPAPLLHRTKVMSPRSTAPLSRRAPPRPPAPIKPKLLRPHFLFPTATESSQCRLYFPSLPQLTAATPARCAPTPAEMQNGTPPCPHPRRAAKWNPADFLKLQDSLTLTIAGNPRTRRLADEHCRADRFSAPRVDPVLR